MMTRPSYVFSEFSNMVSSFPEILGWEAVCMGGGGGG